MPVGSARRMEPIRGFGIDAVARAAERANSRWPVLRLENLDTDLPLPPEAIPVTRSALETPEANSFLPFTGDDALRAAVGDPLEERTGHRYEPRTEIVITSGGAEGILDSLLATIDPGDEVVLTDPTYAGLVNRAHIVGGVPRFVPFAVVDGEWRLDRPSRASAWRRCPSAWRRRGWRGEARGHPPGPSGLVAGTVGGAAEISLRRPVTLDTPLRVVPRDDGSVQVLDGEALVAEARAAPELELDVPDLVGPEPPGATAGWSTGPSAAASSAAGRGRNAVGVFAGAVDGRDLVASPWTPPPWTAGDDGLVLAEHVWAVLDCPTFFAAYADEDELPVSVVARMAARVGAPVRAGEEHVVVAWPLGADGRKRHAASAVLAADGTVLAAARVLMVELR